MQYKINHLEVCDFYILMVCAAVTSSSQTFHHPLVRSLCPLSSHSLVSLFLQPLATVYLLSTCEFT
jgi:hypothetical protein